jgi:short-subunit dehydrogenase
MHSMTRATPPKSEPRAQRRLRERYGPWAVVTGASDGIGRDFALQLAQSGLNLVLVARRGEVLAELGRELEQRHGIQPRVVAADLGTPAGIADVLRATAALDVGLLVASAGFGTSGRFIDAAIGPELDMIDVNCRAVAALAHHFGARFAKQRRGGIVLMSSLVAFQGVPRAANYAATKAYVQSLAEGLRVELAPFDVEVLASAPGPILSGFAKRADMTMGMASSPRAVARGTLDALGRTGTVRPGWLSKLLEWSLTFLPRWGRVRMMGVVMGGMTKHRA